MKIPLFGLPGGGELLVLLITLVIAYIPLIFYIKTLVSTMKEVSEENRKMFPDKMWLLIIPLFGNIYLFFVVSKLGESLGLEFNKRGISVDEEKPGYKIGMAMCILMICSFLPRFIGSITGLAALVCWILHWVKMSKYKAKLIENPIA